MHSDSNASKASFKDSASKAHVLYWDSLVKRGGFYSLDSNDYNYKILRAYYLNDIKYLRSAMINIKRSRQRDSFEMKYLKKEIPNILEIKADEAYQFEYSETFCNFQYIFTISKDSSKINLNTIIYQLKRTSNDSTFLKVVENSNKKLQINNWIDFVTIFYLSDFWNQKQKDDALVLDPTRLVVSGVENLNQDRRLHANSIERSIFKRTALFKAFQMLIEFSGIKKICDE